MHNAMAEALVVHGVVKQSDLRYEFDSLPEANAKAYLATAQAVHDKLLDRARLGDLITKNLPETTNEVDALVEKIRTLTV